MFRLLFLASTIKHYTEDLHNSLCCYTAIEWDIHRETKLQLFFYVKTKKCSIWSMVTHIFTSFITWGHFLRYQVLILRSVTTFSSSIDRWCRSQCSLDLSEVRLLSVLLLTTNSKICHTCILMYLRRGQYKKNQFLLQKWLRESALLHLV